MVFSTVSIPLLEKSSFYTKSGFSTICTRLSGVSLVGQFFMFFGSILDMIPAGGIESIAELSGNVNQVNPQHILKVLNCAKQMAAWAPGVVEKLIIHST